MRPSRPQSMLRQLPDVMAYLVHRDSLMAMAVLAAVLSAAEWIATLPATLSSGAFPLARLMWATYFFLVARKAAMGSRRLPVPSDHLDSWDTLFQPLLQALLASSWSLMVLAVLAASTIGVADFLERYNARPLMFLIDEGVLGYAVMALLIVHLPLAILGALCARTLTGALDPTLGFRLVRRTGAAYVVTFALIACFGLMGHLLDRLGLTLQSAIPIPLAAPVVAHLIGLWIPLAQARLIGGFIHVNREWLTPASAGPAQANPPLGSNERPL